MPAHFDLRQERRGDEAAIASLTQAAFEGHPYSHGTEAAIVGALRAEGALAVSLVAEAGGAVVGHIAISAATVGLDAAGWFLLGPVSVSPPFQRRGIGKALIAAGLGQLRAQPGSLGCVLVGDPEYYTRLGFAPVAGLDYPGVPSVFVLAIRFTDRPPQGAITAHPAFAIEG